MSRTADHHNRIINAATHRETGAIDTFTCAYITDGGTWVITSARKWNDDDRPHDLVAVLPMAIEGSRVLVLRPTVDPELVTALRAAFDQAVA